MEESLDQLQIHFDKNSLWQVNITLAVVMFGVALDIRIAEFKNLMKTPRPVLAGIVSQFVLVPALTLLLVYFFRPYPSIALGMMMVAACPGGNVSNFMSKLAGGNAALSVSLTAFATLVSVLMTPLNLAFWGSMYEPTAEILRTVEISFWELARLVTLILGIPLIVGMTVRARYDTMAGKLSKILKPLSILIFLAFIVVAFSNNLDIFFGYINRVFLLVLAHNGALLVMGYYFARMLRLSTKDQRTLSIETGIQNSGLGLLLVFSFFHGLGGMALLVAFWGIWDIVSGLALAQFWANKPLPEIKQQIEK